MKDKDLVAGLYGLARHSISVNHQENRLLRAAADRLKELTEKPPKLLNEAEHACPYFDGKIEHEGVYGICCGGMRQRYDTENDADAWIAFRCTGNYKLCDGYKELMQE